MPIGVILTDAGFDIEGEGQERFFRAEVAANLAVKKLHPQSLIRLYRISGPTDQSRTGLKLGRTLFFTSSDMKTLGYPLKREYESNV